MVARRLLTSAPPPRLLPIAFVCCFAAEACRGGVGEPGSQAGGGSGGINGKAVRAILDTAVAHFIRLVLVCCGALLVPHGGARPACEG